MVKKILVACATGIATSTLVETKLRELLKKNNIQAEIHHCKIAEINFYKNLLGKIDLLLVTSPYNDKTIKTLNASPYLTGQGIEQLEKQILEILKE